MEAGDATEGDPRFQEMMANVIAATARATEDPQFLALTESDSVLEVTLKGHLFIEREIVRALEEAIPFPEHLNLDRMSFAAKLDLMAASGLLIVGARPALQAFNAARNRLAHRLDGDRLLDASALNAQLPAGLQQVGIAWPEDAKSQVILVCTKLVLVCRMGYILAKAGVPHVLSPPGRDWWESLDGLVGPPP